MPLIRKLGTKWRSLRGPSLSSWALGAMTAFYLLTWIFRYEIGLIRPAANMRFYYFSDNAIINECTHIMYWPMIKLDYVLHRRTGTLTDIYIGDREPMDCSDCGP